MKLNIKPKIEPVEQFNVRIPTSLKKRLETLRTRAAELDADFNGTLVGVLEDFAAELEKQFELRSNSASKTATRRRDIPAVEKLASTDKVATPNGADSDRS